MKVLEFFANLSTVAQVCLAFFCVLLVASVLLFVYKITGRDKTAQRIGKIVVQKFLGVDVGRDDDGTSVKTEDSEDAESEKKNDETNQTSI